MSGYRNKLGPIPDEWFENDTQADAGKDMEPDGFYERLKARLLSSPSADLQARPEQPPQSSPKSPSSDPAAKSGQ
jgi:hypothetical protein